MNEQQSTWARRVRSPFWNESEGRARAFWRILGALLIALAAPAIISAIAVRPLDLPISVLQAVSNAIPAVIALGLVFVWARYVDRRDYRAYGFSLDRKWWSGLVIGVLIGLVGWGGALVTNITFGWASVTAVFSPGSEDFPFRLSFLLFTIAWVFVGFWEEVVFRGLVMRNAIEGLNVSWLSHRTAVFGGWILSSVLFGILHFGQAASSLALVYWVIAGLILGLAYLLTDQLAIPIGLHFAFNFGVNNVFGLASVREAGAQAPTIIRPEFTGPAVFVEIAGVVNTVWLIGLY